MRISFTGAAGIGKTTMARALSERLNIPVLEEDFKDVVRAFAPPPGQSAHAVREERRKACYAWFRNRELVYEKTPDFVEDRCAIDVLFRWLLANISDKENDETLAVINQVRKLLSCIDRLVILPLIETAEPKNHDGVNRVGSSSRLIRAQSLAIGLAFQMMSPEKIVMPGRDISAEERLEDVLKACRTLARRSETK